LRYTAAPFQRKIDDLSVYRKDMIRGPKKKKMFLKSEILIVNESVSQKIGTELTENSQWKTRKE
jgi:hypothetical protein